MSLIKAEDSYCNACVENVKYRSAMSKALAADSNGNAWHRSQLKTIIAMQL